MPFWDIFGHFRPLFSVFFIINCSRLKKIISAAIAVQTALQQLLQDLQYFNSTVCFNEIIFLAGTTALST